MMKHLFRALPALLLVLSCATQHVLAQDPGAARATPIILDQAGPDIFPKSWLTPPVSARAELLKVEQQQRSRRLVERALARYPAAVLRDNLRRVLVLGRLEYSGVPAGGTNSRTAVYVVNDGEPRYTDLAIEGIIHAEFSSILLRNHPRILDREAWQKLNPPGFTYLGTGGVNAIRQQKASQKLDAVMHAEGFLHQYAKADLEDDFNSMAARLLVGDAALWRLMEEYPKLRAKAALVIGFYHHLDPAFTRERFLSFRQSAGESSEKEAPQ